MRGLSGNAVIVTGAGSGIGAAIAERLTAEGARVRTPRARLGQPSGIAAVAASRLPA